MAIIKAVSSHAPIGTAIDYVSREEKTEERLLSGINCMPDTAEDEMQATKELYGKTDGRTYKHFVQSFAPGEDITPDQAHDMAVEYANKCETFKGYEVLVATHKDKDHVHTHFIVNSVSYEDGHKFQMSAHDLQKMKDLSDEMCRERGLSVCEKGKSFEGEERTNIVAYIKEKYQYLTQANEGKAKSYVNDTALAVNECRSVATSQEQFVSMMNERGYSVDWQERHKHITFTDQEGHKVRDTNLSKTYNIGIDKVQLSEQFKRNLSSGKNMQLNTIRDNLIRLEYEKLYIKNASVDFQREINLRKKRLEIVEEQKRKTLDTVQECKTNIKTWKKELDSASIFSFKRKQELRENIEHAQAKIEAVQSHNETIMKNCGFANSDELQSGIKDYNEAMVKYSQMQKECGSIKESQSLFYKDYVSISDGKEVESLSLHSQNVENELRQRYGSEFNSVTYEYAEKTVKYRLSHHDDERDVMDMTQVQRMNYYKDIERDLYERSYGDMNLNIDESHSHDRSL